VEWWAEEKRAGAGSLVREAVCALHTHFDRMT
jgi:hypothetical protein